MKTKPTKIFFFSLLFFSAGVSIVVNAVDEGLMEVEIKKKTKKRKLRRSLSENGLDELDRDAPWDLLDMVVIAGDIETIKDLPENFDLDGQENPMKRTKLIIAAAYGYAGMVETLINKRVDANKQDWDSKSALIYALNNGDPRTVRLLISKVDDETKAAAFNWIKNEQTHDASQIEKLKSMLQKAEIED